MFNISDFQDMNKDIKTNTIISKENSVKEYLRRNPDSKEIYKLSKQISKILVRAKVIKNEQLESEINLEDSQKKLILDSVVHTVQLCFGESNYNKENILDMLEVIKIFEIYTSEIKAEWKNPLIIDNVGLTLDNSPRLDWNFFISEVKKLIN